MSSLKHILLLIDLDGTMRGSTCFIQPLAAKMKPVRIAVDVPPTLMRGF